MTFLLSEFQHDAFNPDPDGEPLPFGRDLGAAAMPSNGSQFVDDVEFTCAHQLREFIGGPIRDVLVALPLDATGVVKLVSNFAGNPKAFMTGQGLIKQWITSLVSRAVRWLIRLLQRLGGWVSDMVGRAVQFIRSTSMIIARQLLGTDDIRLWQLANAPDQAVANLQHSYDRQAQRLTKAIGFGGLVLGILDASNIAGIVLGVVGVTVAVWLGSDYLGGEGVFGGLPNVMQNDLRSLV